MENIVKIDEIRDCVARTLRGISEGILDARDFGMNAEFPENGEIEFRMTVVKDFQTLAVAKVESGEQNETQGGTTKETQNGTTSQQQTETRSGKEIGTSNEINSIQEETSSSLNANKHEQDQVTEFNHVTVP